VLQLEFAESQHSNSFEGLEIYSPSERFKTEGGCRADSSLRQQRTSVQPVKEPLMNTSNLARAAALVVSILVTFGLVDLMASYAYPATPAIQLASAR
jgi:hypothetical protein